MGYLLESGVCVWVGEVKRTLEGEGVTASSLSARRGMGDPVASFGGVCVVMFVDGSDVYWRDGDGVFKLLLLLRFLERDFACFIVCSITLNLFSKRGRLQDIS